jgi:hypothetical protein
MKRYTAEENSHCNGIEPVYDMCGQFYLVSDVQQLARECLPYVTAISIGESIEQHAAVVRKLRAIIGEATAQESVAQRIVEAQKQPGVAAMVELMEKAACSSPETRADAVSKLTWTCGGCETLNHPEAITCKHCGIKPYSGANREGEV